MLKRQDLGRQVVKSPTGTVIIPEFELTIPPKRGQLTTVEGLLRSVISDLSIDQPLRKYQDPPTYGKIDKLLGNLHEALFDDSEGEPVIMTKEGVEVSDEDALNRSFTIKLDDPAGHSWIEFLGQGEGSDPKWSLRQYTRTREQNVELGLDDGGGGKDGVEKHVLHGVEELPKEALEAMKKMSLKEKKKYGETEEEEEEDDIPMLKNEEIFVFPGICSSCSAPLDTMMKRVAIPYFQVRNAQTVDRQRLTDRDT